MSYQNKGIIPIIPKGCGTWWRISGVIYYGGSNAMNIPYVSNQEEGDQMGTEQKSVCALGAIVNTNDMTALRRHRKELRESIKDVDKRLRQLKIGKKEAERHHRKRESDRKLAREALRRVAQDPKGGAASVEAARQLMY